MNLGKMYQDQVISYGFFYKKEEKTVLYTLDKNQMDSYKKHFQFSPWILKFGGYKLTQRCIPSPVSQKGPS